MTHTCKICGKCSDVAEFYAGVTSRCKSCHKEAVRENRKQNAEKYKAYDAERFRKDPKVRERHKRYQSTPEGKASINASKKRWMQNSPEKRAAHVILGNAVRDGRVEKPSVCEKCGCFEPNSRKIHAHHEDYAFPMNVIWVCAMCHKDIHRQ